MKELKKKPAAKKVAKTPVVREAKISVSEANVGKAALRLLSQRLVSTEVSYVQRVLGLTASQAELDAQIMAVRKLPWASIVVPD
jgi:hypothetical protein